MMKKKRYQRLMLMDKANIPTANVDEKTKDKIPTVHADDRLMVNIE